MTDLHHILENLGVSSNVETTSHDMTKTLLNLKEVLLHYALTDFFVTPAFICVLDFGVQCKNDIYINRKLPNEIKPGLSGIREPLRSSSIFGWENYGDLSEVIDWLQASRATEAAKLLMP